MKQFTSIILRVHRPSWCNKKQYSFVFRGSQFQTRPPASILVLSTSHGIKQGTSASCHISSIIIIIMPFGTSASLTKEIRALFINLVEENARRTESVLILFHSTAEFPDLTPNLRRAAPITVL